MQTIITKYHGPGNTRGSRISATSASGQRIFASYQYDLSNEEEHHRAARMLCEKLGWTGRLVCGGLKTGNAYVFDPAVRSHSLEIVS